jgi:hypothetical protein
MPNFQWFFRQFVQSVIFALTASDASADLYFLSQPTAIPLLVCVLFQSLVDPHFHGGLDLERRLSCITCSLIARLVAICPTFAALPEHLSLFTRTSHERRSQHDIATSTLYFLMTNECAM